MSIQHLLCTSENETILLFEQDGVTIKKMKFKTRPSDEAIELLKGEWGVKASKKFDRFVRAFDLFF